MQQLHRGLINRGHCPEHLKQLFSEVSNNLAKGNSSIGTEIESKSHPDQNLNQESKNMSKIVLLHQEYHPKDVSRCTLQ